MAIGDAHSPNAESRSNERMVSGSSVDDAVDHHEHPHVHPDEHQDLMAKEMRLPEAQQEGPRDLRKVRDPT
jgi:hypothetical protein